MRYNLILLLALLFAGCSSTNLEYKNDSISLQNKELSEIFQGQTLYATHENLSDINIDIKVFSSSLNETLVYEYARLNTAYKFKHNYQYILANVFDAKKVEKVRDQDGLGFYTIRLKDGSLLYSLVKTGTKKSLTLLYGLSEENFTALINKQPLKKQKLLGKRAKEHIKSRWNMKLVIMGILLEKEGGKPIRK